MVHEDASTIGDALVEGLIDDVKVDGYKKRLTCSIIRGILGSQHLRTHSDGDGVGREKF
ncbi:MAG: hypothetical protein AB1756_02495 [Acidobacteriota bacterium]